MKFQPWGGGSSEGIRMLCTRDRNTKKERLQAREDEIWEKRDGEG